MNHWREVLDHLVYAVPDLEAGVEDLARRTGVRPAAGGAHPGRGTHNALLGLGSGSYLELIAPDPRQPTPSRPRRFGLDGLGRARLVAWAIRVPDIEDRARRARERGHDPGPVETMGRDRPDGVRLRWRLTSGPAESPSPVPFLIDWGSSPHPSQGAPAGARLLELRGQHPDPESVRRLLLALEVELPIDPGPEPALIATLETPRGPVRLR
jgi:hypothetical protein